LRADAQPWLDEVSLGELLVIFLFLRQHFFNDDRRSMMSGSATSNSATATDLPRKPGNKAAKGAGIGGTVGGALGMLLIALTAFGTTAVLPNVGTGITGSLVAMGAVAGAATGAVLGTLIGWNLPAGRA
jgi:hypothetical protein